MPLPQPEQSFFLLGYPPTQGNFTSDPTFEDCSSANCISSWALRMLNSSNIYIYSLGFYSFFTNLQLGCGNTQSCQERLIETDYVGELYLYNLFTYGSVELVSPAGGFPPPIFFNDSNQSGYTSEVAAWLALAGLDGEGIGVNDTGSGDVYIDPTIWIEPSASQTVQCYPPCTFVLPPITLSTPTTISFPLWTTSLEVGWTTTDTITTTVSGSTATITTRYYTYIIETTTLTIPPLITTLIPVWNTEILGNVTSAIIWPTSSILPPPILVTDDPDPLSQSGVSHPPQTRTIYPPPFPYITTTSSHDPKLPPITYTSGPPKPTCHSGCGSKCHIWCHACNPLLPPLLGGCTGSDFCTSDCPAGTGPGDGKRVAKLVTS
jgi:glucan 1,3-beta-glucosidase